MLLKIFTQVVDNVIVEEYIKRNYRLYSNSDNFWGWKMENARPGLEEAFSEQVSMINENWNGVIAWDELYKYITLLLTYNKRNISPRTCLEQITNIICPIGIIGINATQTEETAQILGTLQQIIHLLTVAVFGAKNPNVGIQNWHKFMGIIHNKLNVM